MESEGSLPCSQKLAMHPCVELDVSSTLRVRCEMYYHCTHRFWIQLAMCFLPPQENKYLPPLLFSSQFLLSTSVCDVQQFVWTDQILEKQNEEDLRPVK